MKRILLLFLILGGMLRVTTAFGQITASGNSGTSTTAYTNGTSNDQIYIWCAYGIGNNQANLTATPPSGTGPWTFKWYYHNQITFSWSAYSTTTGNSSTITGLPSDGYRVEIFDASNTRVGCYVAWVWNMNTNISASLTPTSCNGANLTGASATEGSFTYYNPPPPESLITAGTNISVCFTATHTYVSDLAFYLVGPASCGSPVILLSPNPGAIGQNNVCNGSNNVNTLCFSKSSSAVLNVCNPVASLGGTYGAYGPGGGTAINWAPLIGCNAAVGDWRVQIYDCINQDFGSLTNASISFSNLASVCGSPTTINYSSGSINSVINDNSCTAASASKFQVPPSTTLSSPITINATTSYIWTAAPAVAIPNATTSLSPSVSNIPIGTTTFTLTTTVSYGGTSCTYEASAPFTNTCCTAAANAGTDVVFCAGGTGTIGSPAVTGRTYAWTPATGLSSATDAQPTVTLPNATTTAQTTTYTLTVTNVTDGGCTATDQVNVTVNPLPTAIATPAAQTICSGTSTGIALSSTPAGATFAWTVIQSGVTGANSGAGSSINETLTATGSTAGTATYTITPTLGTCPGTPITVVITVNPVPVVIATPVSQTICSGESTGIALSSTPAGATFDWTISQTGASGASNGSGTSINQVLTATGTAAGNVTYTVTPTIGSCPGTPLDIPITVNPSPVATATPTAQTICSGTSTGIGLSSTPPGATFNWTVVQSDVTGGSDGSGNSIAQTLTASTISGTATYTVTPSIGTCIGTPITVTITVNPVPVATATPTVQTICSGTATGIALTSSPAGSTFDWTVTQSGVSGAFAGNGSSIAQTLTATGSAQGTATYTITPTLGTCPGTPITVVITLDPSPVVTATPTAQTICSGTSTGISLSSTPAGAAFAWTVIQSGATGASAGNGASIAQVLTASGAAAGTATYTVTPTLAGCPGLPIDVVITVNPIPVAAATPTAQTICSGTSTGIALSSTPPGSTFSWTVVQSGATGASAGNGTSIAQVLNATGPAAGTATYTITPSLGGCPGLPIDVTITVSPNPVVTATPANQTICSGTSTGIALTSVPAGATFNWTISQTGASGASNGSGTSIAQVLTATGSVAGNVTYTVTPSIGTCVGLPLDIPITVSPTPVVTATPASQAICSGTSTGIALTSVPAGATFDWTVAESGTSGASAGSGTSINQTLSVTGLVSGTTTYTVTPTIGTCVGLPINVVITVNPTPAAIATPTAQTICSGTATGIALTSSPTGSTFAWTVAQSGVSGASAGNGSSIAQTLTATGSAQGTATYTITPTLGACPGTPITVVITVNPTPVVSAAPANQVICSGTSTGITLTSVPAGATFAWTAAQSGATGASAGNGTSIVQVLTASGAAAGTATYTITPTLAGCAGLSINVAITVNPIPVATATPAVQTICSGATTGITLSSSPTGSTFSWTVNQSGATGATAGNGTSIAQTLSATGSTAGTVTYTVTPGLAGCTGSPISVVITVNPNPVVTATPANQTICSGTSTGIALTSVPVGATFNWTISQTGASGASNGSGTSIAQVLTATGSVAGNVTYTVTPSLGTCVGLPLDIPITVNPTPVAAATPTAQTICSGTSTGIALTSTPAGATFDWTVAESGTSGATAGSGTSINQTLSVTGLVAGTTTYTVTPTIGACVGSPINVVITVNPTPTAIATPTAQTICSGTATGIALTSSPTGSTFAWTVAQSGVSGAATGNGSSIAQTLTATGAAQGTATYTITPTLGACPGTPITVVITVNPTPVITATPAAQTICSGTSTGITLNSVPAGSTFAWTVNQSGATGATAGNGSSIAQVLTASGAATGTVTYTVIPTLAGCPGLPLNVVTTVNPIPAAIATPTAQTICSGATTGIALTSTPAGSTFAWTVTQSGASGGAVGSGNSIAQILSATGSTPGTVTYTVTPTLAGCVGSTMDVVITVNPNPVVTATPANQTICSGTPTGITLTSVPTGATFNWTINQSGTAGATAGSGTSITQTLTATGATAGTTTYSVTPNIGACVGLPLDIPITVNPTPVAAATPTAQTICSGTSTGIALTSTPAGATFDWTVAESGTSGATAGSGTSINQTLSVTGLVAGTTTYTVTPTIGACVGSPINVVITVNPTPTAIATPAAQTICSGTPTGIALTSSPTGSIFAWTVAQSGVSGAAAGNGSSIAQILTTTGAAQGTATYTITPTLGACAGSPITVVITVNPTPVVIATPSIATICSGTSTGIALTSSPTGSTYAWTVVQSGASGASAGSGNTISQTLTSTGTAVGTVTYTITPTLTSCAGLPIDVIITVNPLPTVIATPASQAICSGQTTGVALTSAPAGSTFTWIANATGATGSSNGTGTSIAQMLASTAGGTVAYSVTPSLNGCIGPVSVINITVNANPTLIANPTLPSICAGSSVVLGVSGAVNYTWTPSTGLSATTGNSVTATPAATQAYAISGQDANGCSGTANVIVTVNPVPVTTVSSSDTICEGGSLTLTAGGAASYTWTPVTGLNTSAGNTVIASPVATTTYTVTGTSLNCPSTATVTVFVKPVPVVSAGSDVMICSGESLVLSGSGASTYIWSNGVTNNVAFVPSGTATYTVVGTGTNLCSATDDVTVTVVDPPVIDIVPSTSAGCAPVNVDFQNNSSGAVSYTWDFGDGETSTLADPSHSYLTPGCFDLTVTASTAGGCTTSFTYPSVVCVEASPSASFIPNPATMTTDNPVSSMINLSEDATSYSWDFGDGSAGSTEFSPTHTFPSQTVTSYDIILVAYSSTGCTDTARSHVELYEDIVYYVPNTFTPDGDDYNQTFKPVMASGYDPYSYSLFIYNRWGQIIFESHDASVGWTGNYGVGNEIAMDGTYTWTIEFKVTQTGERRKLQGHVNLLR